MNGLELVASSSTGDAAAAAPAAAPLEESVRRFIKKFGFGNVGFLTLTFAEHIVDPKEAQKRWHSLKTHVLNKRYQGRWIRVIERQKSRRLHYHVLVGIGEDIRSGANFAEFKKRDYRSANVVLRREWTYWRVAAPKYRFGRTEIMPIQKIDEAVAKYIAKYITKHLERRLPIDKGIRLVEYGRNCRIGTTKFQFNSPGAWLWRQKLRRFAHIISPERTINMEGLARRLGRKNWVFRHLGEILAVDLQGVSFPTNYLWAIHEASKGRLTSSDSELEQLCKLDAEPETAFSWPGAWKSREHAVSLFRWKVEKLGGSQKALIHHDLKSSYLVESNLADGEAPF